ncbi:MULTISPECIES: SDR family NAD(P)-dependent oxidoreductase [Microbacterium]|nr:MULTISPECIES: SDR family oxidoreductase [Microbacterium]MCK6065444.1 SDR family oxidoreductase [Microbacterium sp. EYE_512]
MMESSDRVAVITGGAAGIGAAIADALLAAGTRRLVLTYNGSEDAARETVTRLESRGARVIAVRTDVRDEAQVRALAAHCEEEFGRCDLLVNNAGTTRWIPLGDLDAVDDETWNELLSVNVVAAFRTARAFAPLLKASGGVIINIASISAHRGIGSSIPYGVSKAALVQLTRTLAATLGPEIRVNSVSPGTVSTRWQLDHHGDAFAELAAREREVAPLARTLGPEDVAQAVLGLVGAEGVTGVDLIVDGGKHITY